MRRIRMRAKMSVPMRGRVKARPRRSQAFQSSFAKGVDWRLEGVGWKSWDSGADAVSLRRQVDRRRMPLV